MSKIFVTGASGYVGARLAKRLAERGNVVVAGTREPLPQSSLTDGLKNVVYGDLRRKTDWTRLLSEIDVLVHTAGFVHRKEPLSDTERQDARVLNDCLVQELAETAVEMGVKHFLLISTIAVHGTGGTNLPINELAPLLPSTTYAKTKLAGENRLTQCCKNSPTSWTIIRPAMVYGPNCPGNFSDLLRVVRSGVPLPFKHVRNSRSFIYIENLVELLILCIENAAAKNESFVAADPEPASISQLILWIADAMGKRPMIWPFPVFLMRALAGMVGMRSTLSSLVDDFVVDGQKAVTLLGWHPSYDTRRGIALSVSKS